MIHNCHQLALIDHNYSKQELNFEYTYSRLKEFKQLGLKFLPETAQELDSNSLPKFEFKDQVHDLFSADDSGNLVIFYYNIHGNHTTWTKEGTKFPRQFIRKRLAKPLPNQKYWQPPKSGEHPYFTPTVIEKYQNKVKIERLVLVEGELKAYAGYLQGLDIIGLPSNRIPGEPGAPKGKLHEDILQVIKNCKVENVFLLLDADVLVINPFPEKDTSIRQESFYRSVLNFREGLEEIFYDPETSLKNIYFSHIKENLSSSQWKGLDDLLLGHGKTIRPGIIEDLYKGQLAEKYFTGHILNDIKPKSLKKYFGLMSANDYYEKYKHHFKSQKQFIFFNCRYEWDGEKAKQLQHNDIDRYIRIGTTYFKKIKKQTKNGEWEEELEPWSVGEFKIDYPKHPNFRSQILKVDNLCNFPNFNGQFKEIHNNCYNLAKPLKHIPSEGDISTTTSFLKHIFGGEGKIDSDITGDPFTVALDYLSIIHNNPFQKLPVLILVSPEQGTGKTTILSWLKELYGSNMAVMGNTQFQMRFNAHYATKYLIGIDESFLELDKKAEKEKLKQLVTSDSIYVEYKGANIREMPFIGKLIMCSNDADRVMAMDQNDTRWFVIRVPKIKKEDPELLDKLTKEIPAWLNFIKNRKIHHKKEGRLWFKTEYILTDQFYRVVEKTKSRISRIFEEFIIDQFLTFGISPLLMPLNHILERLNDRKLSKYSIDSTELKNHLQDDLGIHPLKKPMHTKIPTDFFSPTGKSEIMWKIGPMRPYVFHVKDFIKGFEDFKAFSETKKIHDEIYNLKEDYYKNLKHKSELQLELIEDEDQLPF